MVDADCMTIFENMVLSKRIYNAECIQQQYINVFLKNWIGHVQKVSERGRQANQQPGMDWGKHAGENTSSSLPEMSNWTLTVVIYWVMNRNDRLISPK